MNVKFIKLILLIAAVIGSVSCSNRQNEKNTKPNIIIFFTDDQGYGDLGCYGAEDFNTPNIDKLAEDGIQFTDFYVAATVCTPSRAALLTGKYPKQVGLHKGVLFPYSETGLSPEETTLPELLKPLGYNTACIGKWHLGHQQQFMPNNQGFDYYYGVPYSNDMDRHLYKHNNFQSPPLPVFKNTDLVEKGPNQDYLTRMWTEASVDYICKIKDNPFFLYIAHNMPHTPWHASEDFRGSSQRGLYGDIIQELDWSMGEIVNALKEEGIFENTIIIFTSDNGPVSRLKNGGSPGPLRGSKATTWEGGMRVPGIICWPAKIESGNICKQPLTTMDLLPTLTGLAGGDISELSGISGRDMQNILFEPEKETDEVFEMLYYGTNGEPEAIRQGDWKLHIAKSRGWTGEGEFPVSLYNLKDDIGEKYNIAKEN
ncbi:MAG: sulfatase, partial [Bacteroidota bacterium]